MSGFKDLHKLASPIEERSATLHQLLTVENVWVYRTLSSLSGKWHSNCLFQSVTTEKKNKAPGPKGKVTMLTGVAKKPSDPSKVKGELMQNNMDAMEVRFLSTNIT